MASELAAEIYRDVYAKPIADRAEFAGWANVLAQGASLEGVYRGFVLSSDYRKLEAQGPKLCAAGLDYFAQEAAQIKKKPKEEFLAKFKDAPFFSAKRALGDALLSHLDEIANDHPRIAKGFSKFAERSIALDPKVSFGSKSRDESSVDAIESWAKTATLDSIKWEALNRIHRVLNARCLSESPRASAPAPGKKKGN